MACSWLTGKQPSESDELHMSVMNRSSSVRNFFTTCDGIGSTAQVFDGAPEITLSLSLSRRWYMARQIDELLVHAVAQTLHDHHLSHGDCIYLLVEEIQKVLCCW